MTTTRLPPKVIRGFSVRDYAYLWIVGGCPLHQWCSGARGIDQGVIDHVRYLIRCTESDPWRYDPGDTEDLMTLRDYLQENIGYPAEEYIPDERTRRRA